MDFLALDIGGAAIKAATGRGFAMSQSFPMWKAAPRLAQELRTIIAEAPPSDHLLVTMTGELADCFESRAAGVRFILGAVNDAADGRHTRVYRTDGKMVTPAVADRDPMSVAAANWHALARFAARFIDSAGLSLLIDIGSTTCDIIPIINGEVAAAAKTDTERLLAGELMFVGVERTPVATIVSELPYRGQPCPIARELFATVRDAHLLKGNLQEDSTDTHTPDGRPATKSFARVRLGRMICADGEDFHHRDAAVIAQAVVDAHRELVSGGIRRVLDRQEPSLSTVIFSGHGEFLARQAVEKLGLKCKYVSLLRELGPEVSRCAPAHALAVLAREAAGL